MYLTGANNGEQVFNSVWILMPPIYNQQKTVGGEEIFLVASMFGRDCRHKRVLFCEESLQWCLLSSLIFRGRHKKCGKLLHRFPLCQVFWKGVSSLSVDTCMSPTCLCGFCRVFCRQSRRLWFLTHFAAHVVYQQQKEKQELMSPVALRRWSLVIAEWWPPHA